MPFTEVDLVKTVISKNLVTTVMNDETLVTFV